MITTRRAATTLSLAMALSLASPLALAKSEKVIEEVFEVGNIEQLVLDAGVGTVDVLPSTDGKIHVYVKVTESDSWVLFGNDPDDAELTVKQRGERIRFSLTEDDVGEEWQVAVPALASVSINLGVGEAKIKDINSDIDLDVGVGQATVRALAANFGKAKLESGVGETRIRADSGRESNQRAMVSDESVWTGSGEHRIDIDVGVGEASVTLD